MSQKEEKVKLTIWQKVDRQCRAFANFVYNKQTREVMARSKTSWAKIGLFYLCYYGFLAAFFSTCLAIFLTTLNEPGKGGPKNVDFLQGERSAPGLNLVVNLFDYETDTNTKVKAIQSYLDGFENSGYGSLCGEPGGDKDKPCKFNQTMLEECSGLLPNNKFGLDTKTPCVFIKLNKVYGWVPKNGNSEYLKLACTVKDGKKIEVKPEGFLISAFPFKGEKFYQTPPVAVVVPATDKVTVKCSLKGDNVKLSESFVASRAYGRIQFDVKP